MQRGSTARVKVFARIRWRYSKIFFHYDGYLRIWLDRDINFAVGEGLSADIMSLPRLLTSRSNERLNEDSRIK